MINNIVYFIIRYILGWKFKMMAKNDSFDNNIIIYNSNGILEHYFYNTIIWLENLQNVFNMENISDKMIDKIERLFDKNSSDILFIDINYREYSIQLKEGKSFIELKTSSNDNIYNDLLEMIDINNNMKNREIEINMEDSLLKYYPIMSSLIMSICYFNIC
jgi:hypothetical protein